MSDTSDLPFTILISPYLTGQSYKREVARTTAWPRTGLVTCDSRDAQRDWIECLGLVEVIWIKVQIPKRCANDFSQEVEKFRSSIKCRYMVIGRLIAIEVL